MNETKLYKISEASKLLGVGQGILRLWDKQGDIKAIRSPGGIRLFDISSINGSIVSKASSKQSIVLYSRVSSNKQRDDLKRQQQYLKSKLSPIESTRFDILEIQDIGSGINFKRPGLLRILGLVKEGKVSRIVVASRDRLARFGVELIQWICSEFKTQIVVLDSEDTTPESELGNDLMAIVQVYCCRWNGRRRYKAKGDNLNHQSNETEIEPNKGTKGETESMGRLLQISLQQDNWDDDQQEHTFSSEEEILP